MSETYQAQAGAATASEIRATLGPAEDDLIIEVLAIGPTGAEVLDAYAWLRADDRLPGHEPHGRTARVFEILQAALPGRCQVGALS